MQIQWQALDHFAGQASLVGQDIGVILNVIEKRVEELVTPAPCNDTEEPKKQFSSAAVSADCRAAFLSYYDLLYLRANMQLIIQTKVP